MRDYRPGDETQLVALFERVFGRAMTLDQWRWKLKGRDTHLENVWVAEAGDRLVGQYAVIPTLAKIEGRAKQAAISVDAMVHPQFRRRGILTALVRHGHQALSEAGFAFTLGLPNEQWGSREAALGWRRLFPLRWLTRPLRPEAMLARRLGAPSLARLTLLGTLWNRSLRRGRASQGNLEVRHVAAAGEAFDALWESCAGDASASISRDASWVRWRYLEAVPHRFRVLLAEREGKPAGFLAYRIDRSAERSVGLIPEILTAKTDAAALEALLEAALGQFLAEGVESAVTLAVPGAWMYAALRRRGFLPRRQAFSVGIIPLGDEIPMHVLSDAASWHMMGGDFDLL